MIKLSLAHEFDEKHEKLDLVTRNYFKILKRFRKKEELNKFMKFFAHDQDDNYLIKEEQPPVQPGNYQSNILLRKKRKSLPCPFEDEKKSFNLYPVLEKQQIENNLLKKHFKKQLCVKRRNDDEKENTERINEIKREQKLPPMTKRNKKVQSLKEQFFKRTTLKKDYQKDLFIKIKQISSTSNLKPLQKKTKKTLVKIQKVSKQKNKQLVLKYKNKLQMNQQKRPLVQNKHFEQSNRVTGWRLIDEFQFGEHNQMFGIDQSI